MRTTIKRANGDVCSWLMPGLSGQLNELQSDRRFAISLFAGRPHTTPQWLLWFNHNELFIHAGCHQAFARPSLA